MAKKQQTASLPPPVNRVMASLLIPFAAALLLFTFFSGNNPEDRTATALFLGVLGATSWIVGLRWYGIPGMGLRGGRPLFASIGFAVLAWLVAFVARLYFVDSSGLGSTGAAAQFFHLLVFEAFCTQLYAFGPFFRSVAAWRGPLTAAIGSGLVFAFVGLFYFSEPHTLSLQALFYFVTWGILYGLIRLRSGSILGSVIVQAIQAFTTWFVLLPPASPDVTWLGWMHLVSGILFIVIIWRLWPKTEEDYRV